jgi:hypothetical protein
VFANFIKDAPVTGNYLGRDPANQKAGYRISGRIFYQKFKNVVKVFFAKLESRRISNRNKGRIIRPDTGIWCIPQIETFFFF